MAGTDPKHPGVKRIEEFESLLTGKHTNAQLEENLQRLSKELDEPGSSDEAAKTAAGIIRAKIKAIKKEYPDLVKRKEYLRPGYLLRGIERRAQEIIETPKVDLDANWVERVNHEMKADPVLNALYFDNEDEGLEGAMQKLNQFGYQIRSKKDLVIIVQNSVREALEMEIPEENVLNISNILMAMKNEGSLIRLKTKLETELAKTAPVPAKSDLSVVAPGHEQGRMVEGAKSEILKEIEDVRTELMNDPVLHAIYVKEGKEKIKEINEVGALHYDENLRYSVDSIGRLGSALTKALGRFKTEFKLGEVPKDPLKTEAVCEWIQKGKIRGQDIKALVAHIENELLNETKNPTKAIKEVISQKAEDKNLRGEKLDKTPDEKSGPFVTLVRAASPIVTSKTSDKPVEVIQPVMVDEGEKSADQHDKGDEEREPKDLEKLALGHAPREFKEWKRLFRILHFRDLPKDPDQAAKVKKNRENLLGTSDEKSFNILRSELKRGILRRFINAKDPIRAMEAMGGVENLDEKSIKGNLATVIQGIKLKIEEARLKIAESTLGKENKKPLIDSTQTPTETKTAIQPKQPKAVSTVEGPPNIKTEANSMLATGMDMEPKSNPEQNRRSEKLRENIESIKSILAETDSPEEKRGYQSTLSELGIGMELTQPSLEPIIQAPTETAPEKPTAEAIVKLLMEDKSLEALIQELEVVRNIMANREFTIKFGLTNKAFGGIKDFERKAKRMESNDDPMIRAASKEELLMEHVNVALEQNPKLTESWDPGSSPGKIAAYFKKMWTEYMTRIKT